MYNFTTIPIVRNDFNYKIKIILGIIAISLLIAIMFAYILPAINDNITSSNEKLNNLPTTEVKNQAVIPFTPPEVNI